MPDKSAPDKYETQPDAWFRQGRFLRIWAPEDVEIHAKYFILLDNKNKEGQGVLVRTIDEDEEGRLFRDSEALQNTVVLRRSKADAHSDASSQSTTAPDFMVAYMVDHTPHEVAQRTYVFVEHTYNIPFSKYKCED